MSEPHVVYTVREMFDELRVDLKDVRDRLTKLEQTAATARSVRRALYAAASSPVLAGLVAWLIANR